MDCADGALRLSLPAIFQFPFLCARHRFEICQRTVRKGSLQLASIAQFEREIMLTRQREGIAKAKGEGKYKGGRQRPGRIPQRFMHLSRKAWAQQKSPIGFDMLVAVGG
jgi:DNA invertase Pin-like site-specific DNA recombinase